MPKDIKFSAREELIKSIELYNGEKIEDSDLTNDDLIMLALAITLKDGIL